MLLVSALSMPLALLALLMGMARLQEALDGGLVAGPAPAEPALLEPALLEPAPAEPALAGPVTLLGIDAVTAELTPA